MSAAYLKGPTAVPITRVAHWRAGKHRYESAVLAAEVAARGKVPLEHYRCNRCGGFHLAGSRGGGYNVKAAKGLLW